MKHPTPEQLRRLCDNNPYEDDVVRRSSRLSGWGVIGIIFGTVVVFLGIVLWAGSIVLPEVGK